MSEQIIVSYVRKDQGSKNPHLTAVYGKRGKEKGVIFTVSDVPYDGQLDELRVRLSDTLNDKIFESRAALSLVGWEEVIKFKLDKELPISLFEFGKTVPPGKVKFQGMSINHVGPNKGLYIITNATLNGKAHATRISLGVTNLDDALRQDIVNEVIGMITTTTPSDTVAAARRSLAEIVHDIVSTKGLTSDEVYKAATSGDTSRFISAITLDRATNSRPRKGRT